jgi:2,3-bisphosphoglycerate-independent phosphoglycerate mutase
MHLESEDVAFRGNFGTVDDELVILDRRAGRILDVQPLAESLDGMVIDDVTFAVKPGTAHRAGVILRGPSLSPAVTDADPHEPGAQVRQVTATNDTPEARRTADLVNKFHAAAHEVLKGHPLNTERRAADKLPANYILLRGGGSLGNMQSFKERFGLKGCCVAGGGLYKGVGAILGMDVVDVPGATGLWNTDIGAKFHKAVAELETHDFVFVHVKATDSLAEDGNYAGKRDFIEKIDAAASTFLDLPADVLLIMTADHSTPCELGQHSADPVPILFHGSGDPVPILFHGSGVRTDSVEAFGERDCARGCLGLMSGVNVMSHVMNLLGRLPLIGA